MIVEIYERRRLHRWWSSTWAMTVLGYLAKLILGVLGLIVSVAWIAHIVIYLLIDPPLSAFLNEIFIKLDDIWGLLRTAAFSFFCFYLLVSVIAGAMMISLKMVFITIHPMTVIQLCATAFAYYAQATAAQEIFGHTLQSLRGIKYSYKYNVIQIVFIVLAGLTFLKAVVPYNLRDGEEKILAADSNFLREHVAANIFNNEHGGFLGLSFIEIFLSRMHVARFCLNVVAWRKERRCEQCPPVRSSDIGNKLSSNYYTALGTVIHVQDHEFIRSRISGFSRVSLFSWLKLFFKQFFRSVSKSDYTTLRLGFVMNHCSGNPKFNFYKYMTRALENDFKKVIGIRHNEWGVVWFLIRPHYLP
ncbi:hypothetical protein ACS0TY_021154 [Phlomoides rotata]